MSRTLPDTGLQILAKSADGKYLTPTTLEALLAPDDNMLVADPATGRFIVSKQAAAYKHSLEWHVDPVNGLDDYEGSYSRPFRTIARAGVVIGNSGGTLYLHANTFTEDVNWGALNTDIVGASAGGLTRLEGAWVFSHASSSVRVSNCAFADTIDHSGDGNLYFSESQHTGVFTKSSDGYLEVSDSDFAGAGFNVTGAGIVAIIGSKVNFPAVANASAVLSISGGPNTAGLSVTSGSVVVDGGASLFPAEAGLPSVISAASGVVLLRNSSVYKSDGTPGIVNLAGPHSISNIVYDYAASTLAGANLGLTAQFDAVKSAGPIAAASIEITYSQDRAYAAGVITERNGSLYKSNGPIPAGTAWAIGTIVGSATWAPLVAAPVVALGQRRNITKITASAGNGVMYIADNLLFFSKSSAGNVCTAGALSATSFTPSASTNGLVNAYQIFFPDAETGTVIDAGLYNTSAYALFSSGNLYTWGANTFGQLGLGNTTDAYVPTLSTTGVEKVFTTPSQDNRAWSYAKLFIQKTDKKIYCTGYNGQGQLGVGDTTNRTSWTVINALGLNVKSLWNLGGYAGATFCQTSTGNVYVTGYNGQGQLGLGNTTQQNGFVLNNAWIGGDLTQEIKYCDGGMGYSNDTGYSDSGNVVVFSDNGTTSVLKTSGANEWGTIGNGTVGGQVTSPITPTGITGRIQKVTRTGAALGNIFVLKADGTYWNWGWNNVGQLGRGDTATTGTPAQVATGVSDMFDLAAAASFGYSCTSPMVVKADGYYMAGANGYGQCGIGSTANALTLTKVKIPKGVSIKLMGQMASSNDGMTRIAVTSDNKLFAWGYNTYNAIRASDTNTTVMPIEYTPGVFNL